MTGTIPTRHKEAVRRPTDVGKTLARSLIIRAMRRADLHHVLRGKPGAFGLVVPDPDDRAVFVEAARDLLRTLTSDRFATGLDLFDDEYAIVDFESDRDRRLKTSDAAMRNLLMANTRLFAFAAAVGDFPPLFHVASDGIVLPERIDRHALRGALHAVLGQVPSPALLDAAYGVPLSMIGPIVKPGRSAARIILGLTLAKADGPAAPTGPADTREHPTLDDLHGLGEAAEWGRSLARDVVDYKAGTLPWSEVDRGILVSGPPGTGKTLFAQALAGTCKVPVHIHSLARWQAKGYLNDLLKAMRGAFEEAKKAAPCILFVDELDSFGDRDRLSGRNENYEREVINAFLECLDGAERREGVVVVGATNHSDRIDAAIRRPGRLDRHVAIPLPDLEARKGILRHHLRDALPGADLTETAERLAGASGAMIEQAVRDARRRARTERRDLRADDLAAVLPKRTRLSDADYRRACIHEAGHAVVGCLLARESGKVPAEVRVFGEVSTESTAGETRYHRPYRIMRTKAAYLAEITGLLAGIVAEEVILGIHSDGGGGSEGSDLHQATMLAAAMEASLGFGGNLAYLASVDDTDLLERLRSDPSLRRAANRTLAECRERAGALVSANRPALEGLAAVLAKCGRASPGDLSGIVPAGGRGSGGAPP